jgi:hypothetical protein
MEGVLPAAVAVVGLACGFAGRWAAELFLERRAARLRAPRGGEGRRG